MHRFRSNSRKRRYRDSDVVGWTMGKIYDLKTSLNINPIKLGLFWLGKGLGGGHYGPHLVFRERLRVTT